MYLPGKSDYLAFRKGLGLIGWILLISWWYLPLLFIVYTCIYGYRFLIWIGEEVNYLGSAIRRG